MLGLLVDDLGTRLKGAGVGDVLTIETTAPEGHEREDIRGKDLQVELTVTAIKRVTPRTPGEIMEMFDLASEDILREQVKLALEQRRDAEQAGVMREQAVEQLATSLEFDLPERLSAEQAQRDLDRIRLEMLYEGTMDEAAVEAKLAEIRGDSAGRSQRRLKLFFILQRLAEHFKVDVSEQEINARISTMATQQGVRPEQLRVDMAQSGQLSAVAGQIRDHKAADQLVAEWQARRAEGDAATSAED